MMAGYLLDTNHLSDALKPVSQTRDRIQEECRKGNKVGTCVPVLCELEVGVQQLSRKEILERTLDRLLKQVRIWPIDREVAHHYGAIYLELRGRGRVLSQVDIMLAALSRHMDLTLLTSDRDFEALPNLRTEDWSA